MHLRTILTGIIPDSKIHLLVRAYDVVGDIAVTIIPEELLEFETEIGNAILHSNSNIKVVLKRDGNYSGTFRTIPLTVISGEQRTETICSEFGVRLQLDLGVVYYSSRLSGERKRVADSVGAGETVLVMFSGIAPYPIMMSKHSKAQHITGVELNSIAHKYAMDNVRLNKTNNIRLIHGDVKEVLPSFNQSFDRIVIPFPDAPLPFLPTALDVLKDIGTIHLYTFSSKRPDGKLTDSIAQICKDNNRTLVDSGIHFCGHRSPKMYRVCLDLVIR
jgi:tRNA (guanine37-N1)-methyltransferase